MVVRALYQNNVHFVPTHLPILHLPSFNADDEAMVRRLLLVPFNVRFRGSQTYDPGDPTHRLADPKVRVWAGSQEAREQMLVWMVHGAIQYHTDGLGTPPALLVAATREYMQDNDTVGGFIAAECVTGSHHRVPSKDLLAAYNLCNPERQLNTKQFKTKMTRRGYEYRKSHGAVIVVGIDLDRTGDGG